MPMLTRVAYADIPDERRMIVISDVHGHADWLRALLSKVHFGTEDILVLVGDVIERGMQNLETLRLTMALAREYTVYQLIGNVDEWALSVPFGASAAELMANIALFSHHHGSSFSGELCAELGVELSETTDMEALRAQIRTHFAPEYAYMEGLPTILETPRYRFVHGGMPQVPLASLEGRPAREITKWDAFMDGGLCFDKYVVVGHWPVCLYENGIMHFTPVVNHEQRIIAIDGGCGVKRRSGQLNALILQNGQISWESYDPLPERVALDAQPGSAHGHCITYMKSAVTLLERREDMARVAHGADAYEMWVPALCLYDDKGQCRCNDATDYRLPVAPGDALKVVMETSMGAICKKGGVLGWYSGRLD